MFKNFKVRTRLIFLISFTFFILFVLGVLQIFYSQKMRENIDNLYFGGVNEIYDLDMVKDGFTAIAKNIYQTQIGLMDGTEGADNIQRAQPTITSNWNSYLSSSAQHLSPELLAERNELVTRLQQTTKNAADTIQKLTESIRQQNKEQLNINANKAFFSLIDSIRNDVSQLISLYVKDSKDDYEAAVVSLNNFELFVILLYLLAIAISIILSILIIRSIVSPLKYAVEHVNHVAEGDTTKDIEVQSGGELGTLLVALQKMINSSKKMSLTFNSIASGDLSAEVIPRSDLDMLGHSLNDMVIQMREMIGEIKQEVNSLTTSSQEIMTSLSQLSAGAAESAAAVTETTTTTEELKQTAHLSADKAKEVLTNIEETLQTLKQSERSVADTILDINQIHERMKIISDSILKLSEKSLAIAEIMDTVNDLAEQSNLLAVNAAIEAAKAGEQGRSFGVVAQEIRTLAEQSKGATVQVKSLLNEIQNATNAAVLATEQGSKAVAKGVDQSTQTNESIKALASNMSKVIQASNQISLSSQQQLVGVEQVTVAMTNISEATNQHVEQLRQIETAISALNQVGNSLKELTDRYKIDGVKIENSTIRPKLAKMYSRVS